MSTFRETFSYQQNLTSYDFGGIIKGVLPQGVYGIGSVSYGSGTAGVVSDLILTDIYAVVNNTSQADTASYKDYAVRVYIPSETLSTTTTLPGFSNNYPLLAIRTAYTGSGTSKTVLVTVEKTITSGTRESGTESTDHTRRAEDVIIGRYAMSEVGFNTSSAFDTSWAMYALKKGSFASPVVNYGFFVTPIDGSTTDKVGVDSGTALTRSSIVSLPSSTLSVKNSGSTRYNYVYLDSTGALKIQPGTASAYENFFGRSIVALIDKTSGSTVVDQSKIKNVLGSVRNEIDAASLRVNTTSSTTSSVGSNGEINPSFNGLTIAPNFSVAATKSYTAQDVLAELWKDVTTLRGSGTIDSTYSTIVLISAATKDLKDRMSDAETIHSNLFASLPPTLTAFSTLTATPSTSTSVYLSTDASYFTITSKTKGTAIYGSESSVTYKIPSSTQTHAGLMSSDDKKKLDTLTAGSDVSYSVKKQIDDSIAANNKAMGVSSDGTTRYSETGVTQTMTLEARVRNLEKLLMGKKVQSTVASDTDSGSITVGDLSVSGTLRY